MILTYVVINMIIASILALSLKELDQDIPNYFYPLILLAGILLIIAYLARPKEE